MIKKIIIILLIASLAAIVYWQVSKVDQASIQESTSTPTLFYKASKDTSTITSRPAKNKELEVAQIDPSKLVAQQATIKPEWEKKLVHNLLSFQAADTFVILQYQGERNITDDTNQVSVAHEVIVSYQKNGQLTGGFTALIDPQSGKILKTWNRLRLYPKDTQIEISEPEN